MNIEELRTEAKKMDRMVDRVELKDSKFTAEGKLRTAGKEYGVSEEGFMQISGRLGYPGRYLRKLPNPLVGEIMTHLLHRDDTPQGVVLQEGVVVGLANNDVPFLHANRVLDNVLEVLTAKNVAEDHMTINSAVFTPRESFITIVTDDFMDVMGATTKGTARVDDIVRAGIQVRYSGFNEIPPQISSYLDRLACLNGMVRPVDGVRYKMSGATEDALLAQMKEAMTTAIGIYPEMISNFKKAKEVKVDSLAIFRRLFAEHGISKRLQTRVLERYETEPADEQGTLFGVINSFTAAANGDLPPSERHFLHVLGGRITHDVEQHRCQVCHSRLN